MRPEELPEPADTPQPPEPSRASLEASEEEALLRHLRRYKARTERPRQGRTVLTAGTVVAGAALLIVVASVARWSRSESPVPQVASTPVHPTARVEPPPSRTGRLADARVSPDAPARPDTVTPEGRPERESSQAPAPAGPAPATVNTGAEPPAAREANATPPPTPAAPAPAAPAPAPRTPAAPAPAPRTPAAPAPAPRTPAAPAPAPRTPAAPAPAPPASATRIAAPPAAPPAPPAPAPAPAAVAPPRSAAAKATLVRYQPRERLAILSTGDSKERVFDRFATRFEQSDGSVVRIEGMRGRASGRSAHHAQVEVADVVLADNGAAHLYWFVFGDGRLVAWGRPEEWPAASRRHDIEIDYQPAAARPRRLP